MKFPLKLIDDQIVANIILSSNKYRIGLKLVNFIVDTGSPKSFLSEGDALRLQIPIDSLREPTPIRMGGGRYQVFKTKSFSFFFKKDDNETHKIEMPNFFVAKTAKKSDQAIFESQNFPSILGVDFFMMNSLSLHFDPNSNIMYIELKEEKSK